MKKLFIIAFLAIISFISCNKDLIEPDTSLSTLKNEIFFDSNQNTIVFESSKNLKSLYDGLKLEKEKETNLIKEYYNRGFVPMRLVGNSTEIEFQKFIEKKKSKLNNFNDLLGNDIILNDNFAALLNDKGEIQVSDSIYRYTKKGLLIVHITNRKLLNGETSTFLGKNSNKNPAIKMYVPNPDSFQNFSVSRIDDCDNRPIEYYKTAQLNKSPYYYPEDEYYGCDSGGGGGGSSGNKIDIPDTSNYNVCVNTKAGWIDNIFGKSYVCEYKFNSKRKLRTIFESNDFYFFQDVYAQAKFKQWTWFGWFSDRSADEVYLLNKKVILNTKRKSRGFDLSINLSDVEKIYNSIHKFFLSKPDTQIIHFTNEYDFNTQVTTIYTPDLNNLLSIASKNLNIYVPNTNIKKPLKTIDFNLKNFFGKKINKAITINILSLKYSLSNSDIIKLSYEALSKRKIDLKKGETGAIVFTYQNSETLEVRPVAYSLFGERISVNKRAVASRTFDVPQNFLIDDFSILFRYKNDHATNNTTKNIGFKFKFSIDVVNSVDIEIESGAKYRGVWGGSKFKVKY